MQTDNLAICYLVFELQGLEGAYINKISELENGVLKLKLHTKQGSKDLIISHNVLFISTYSHQARHGKSPFAQALRSELYNKRIIGVEQYLSDRVVAINFQEHRLILEFMGEGNKIFTGNEGKIISCQKKEEWSDRVTKKGEIYKYPKQKSANPKDLDLQQAAKIFDTSDKDAIRALLAGVNISPLLAEEIFFRLKIAKTKPAKELSPAEIEKISNLVRDFFSPEKNQIQPALYTDFAYPFRLLHLPQEPAKMPSFNACFDEMFVHHDTKKEDKTKQEKDNSVSKLEFMRKQQDLAREKFTKQIEENTKRGELIYQYFAEIEEIKSEVQKLSKSGLSEKEIARKIAEDAKSKPVLKKFVKLDMKSKRIELDM